MDLGCSSEDGLRWWVKLQTLVDHVDFACSPKIESRNVESRVLFGTESPDKTQHRLLGSSVQTCFLDCCEDRLKPQRPRHVLCYVMLIWRLYKTALRKD